jgi:serine protease Do
MRTSRYNKIMSSHRHSVWAGLAFAVLVSQGITALAADPPVKASVRALEDHMQKVIDEASPSIVAIAVSQAKYPPLPAAERKQPGRLGRYTPQIPDRFFPGGPRVAQIDRLDLSDPANIGDHTFGSGIVLDARAGFILTSYHLIDGATKVFVRSSSGKGSYADIHAADARSDLAVLQLIDRVDGLKTAMLGTARLVEAPDGTKPNLKRGSFVIALGHPLAAGFVDGQPSASWGILSNIRRRSAPQPLREELRPKPLHQYGSLLQTDARVTLGSSGSALLNMDGDVIGIASSVAAVNGSEASGGFAMPLDANTRRIIATLLKGQEVEYGFLGVSPGGERGSVIISSVTPGCPAALAGLRGGEVLESVDGNPLIEQDDLLLYVGGALAGTQVTLTVRRGEQRIPVVLTLAKIANPLPFIASQAPPSLAGLKIDYASVRLLQLFNARDPLRVAPPQGVSVRELEPGSVAEARFKEAGETVSSWIITQVDGKAVAQPADFYRAVERKASVKLTLVDPTAPTRTATMTLP